jgi:hypothetical protein
MLKGLELFTESNDSENKLSEAVRAEMYTRLYKWAAEDFTSVKDQQDFIKDLLNWAKSVERRLTRQGHAIATHRHTLLPHYHAFHGSPAIGAKTTLSPTNPSKLTWPQGTLFKMIENTTGANSNIRNNLIVNNRRPIVGDAEFGNIGRKLAIPILKQKSFNTIIVKK